MKLIQAVKANLALDEMAKEKYGYPVAFAVYSAKKRLAEHVEFFLKEQDALIVEHAKKNAFGEVDITDGRFTFSDSESAKAYAESIKKLNAVEISVEKITSAAPEFVKPEWIAALEGVLEFKEG